MMTDSKLQMLVDGELCGEERGELIRRLETEPDAWKRVAMAFLHQQLVDQAASELVTADREKEVARQVPSARKDSADSGAAQWSMKWHSMVAIVIATLMVGFWLGSFWAGSNSNEIANDASKRDLVTKDLPRNLIHGSEMSLEDALARCVTPIPQSFRRELLRAGYWLDEGLQVTQVSLPNGNKLEMPVRRYDIHYLGDAAYQ